jgi:hypothetical protein
MSTHDPETVRRFTRPEPDDLAARLSALERELEAERAARRHAERVASDLALVVAAESRRAEDEAAARGDAESVSKGMAAMIALENARAQKAENRLAELERLWELERQAAANAAH